MFARFVSMRLKSGNLTEFNRILEKEVIPLLQRQIRFPRGNRFDEPERGRSGWHQHLGTEREC